MKKKPEELRSWRWYGPDDFRSFGQRSRMLQMGYHNEEYLNKPIIAIINTWSDINPCHSHFKERAEQVRRGILQAGGFPVELPAMSLAENFVKPTTMLYRNFLAMETEELLRCHPVDGAVLMGGCDKTTPALIMGAVSAGLPFIYMPAGPMLGGNWKGQKLGSGSDAFKYWDERRAGNITKQDWDEMEVGIARSAGHCMVMGTASTMTAIAESLGLTLSGASSIPASDSNHARMANACGARAVNMVWEDLTPAKILTRHSFENCITTAMAMGCSTNAIIHVIAMARRAGIDITLDDFDKASRTTPVIANVRPSGDKYLMEDFYYAGGIRALMKELSPKLHLDAMTVSGHRLGETIETAQNYNDDVIRKLDNAIYNEGALAVLRGNLAPDGCVIKPSACAPNLRKTSGKALVYESYPELKENIDRDDLECDANTVLILKNAGPLGAPGMPEWGMLPIPKKLLKQGIRDLVRISDARMSGTSYGACILHVSPEAHLGGNFALVKTGDVIELDVDKRTLNMLVSDEELAERRKAFKPREAPYQRGYGYIFAKHITQAHEGCDFDFLETKFGAMPPEPAIH